MCVHVCERCQCASRVHWFPASGVSWCVSGGWGFAGEYVVFSGFLPCWCSLTVLGPTFMAHLYGAPPPPPPPVVGAHIVAVAHYDGGAAAGTGSSRHRGPAVSSSSSDVADEFPFVCENCLGPNPYVRMVQAVNGAACKLTGRPFTTFKWRVRGKTTGGAWKVTQVCIEVAKMKHCCQVCLHDMTYAVPLAVRDSVLANNPHNVAIPTSEASQHYFFQRKAREQAILDDKQKVAEQLALSAPPPPPPRILSDSIAALLPSPPPPPPVPGKEEDAVDVATGEEDGHRSDDEDVNDTGREMPIEKRKREDGKEGVDYAAKEGSGMDLEKKTTSSDKDGDEPDAKRSKQN